jgi:hypothetical protein
MRTNDVLVWADGGLRAPRLLPVEQVPRLLPRFHAHAEEDRESGGAPPSSRHVETSTEKSATSSTFVFALSLTQNDRRTCPATMERGFVIRGGMSDKTCSIDPSYASLLRLIPYPQPRGAIPEDSNLLRFSDRPHPCRYLFVILWTSSILTPHLTQCSAVAVPDVHFHRHRPRKLQLQVRPEYLRARDEGEEAHSRVNEATVGRAGSTDETEDAARESRLAKDQHYCLSIVTRSRPNCPPLPARMRASRLEAGVYVGE